MTSGRVVALAVLLTPLCAFAQRSNDTGKASDAEAAKQVEISQVIPGVLNPPLVEPSALPPAFLPPQMPNVNVCFKMRTYVVARDSKDSDSTHLVRYTTCTPSNARVVQKAAQPR